MHPNLIAPVLFVHFPVQVKHRNTGKRPADCRHLSGLFIIGLILAVLSVKLGTFSEFMQRKGKLRRLYTNLLANKASVIHQCFPLLVRGEMKPSHHPSFSSSQMKTGSSVHLHNSSRKLL